MRRRSAIISLAVGASLEDQATIGVLSLLNVGAHHSGALLTRGKAVCCNAGAASSSSELVIPPVEFSELTRSSTMSSDQGWRQV